MDSSTTPNSKAASELLRKALAARKIQPSQVAPQPQSGRDKKDLEDANIVSLLCAGFRLWAQDDLIHPLDYMAYAAEDFPAYPAPLANYRATLLGNPLNMEAASGTLVQCTKWAKDSCSFQRISGSTIAWTFSHYSEDVQLAVCKTLQIIGQTTHFTRAERLTLWRTILKPSDAIPADVMTKLEHHLAALEQSLIAKDPMMPQHLRNSHALLIQYPETKHLLEDHEIRNLIAGAEVHTNTQIVAKAAKTATKGKKSLPTLDML